MELFPDHLPDLKEQIAEVQREITTRERVFPRWVSQGTLKKETADYRLSCMKAVLHTLEKTEKGKTSE